MPMRWQTGFRTIAYSLEISVNYVAGMEIMEALGDTGQLVAGVSVGPNIIAETPTRPR